jgi:hypothetical protein
MDLTVNFEEGVNFSATENYVIITGKLCVHDINIVPV